MRNINTTVVTADSLLLRAPVRRTKENTKPFSHKSQMEAFTKFQATIFISLKEVRSFVAKAINTRFAKINNIHNLKFT